MITHIHRMSRAFSFPAVDDFANGMVCVCVEKE